MTYTIIISALLLITAALLVIAIYHQKHMSDELRAKQALDDKIRTDSGGDGFCGW